MACVPPACTDGFIGMFPQDPGFEVEATSVLHSDVNLMAELGMASSMTDDPGVSVAVSSRRHVFHSEHLTLGHVHSRSYQGPIQVSPVIHGGSFTSPTGVTLLDSEHENDGDKLVAEVV